MPITLNKEFILNKYKIDNLDELKNLNLWGHDLEDVEIIKDLPNLEVIGLSVNRIKTLKYFANCSNLSELFLRKNCIENLEEIKYLKNCKMLKILWLEENPICDNPNYREYIVKSLPNLVKLDNIPITAAERENHKTEEIESKQSFKKETHVIVETRRKCFDGNSIYRNRKEPQLNKNEHSRESFQQQNFTSNCVLNSNNSKWDFTFSNKTSEPLKHQIVYNKNLKEERASRQNSPLRTDYMNQFKNLDELTSFFSINKEAKKQSTNKKLDDKKNFVYNSNNNDLIRQKIKNSNYFTNGFKDINNRNIDTKSESNPNKTNYNSVRKIAKTKSNLHLIKAIFNLLEELDNSQLAYIKNLIDNKLDEDRAGHTQSIN
jgi:hypothetical protein